MIATLLPIAARQCPNGANDYDAYRDARGRLHLDAGCDSTP
jgi:hypothetical protein